jgi:uncharacterized membrane protein YhaH (DUF805 family)
MKKTKTSSDFWYVGGVVVIVFITILLIFNSLMQHQITKAYNQGYEQGNNKSCPWIMDSSSLGIFGETPTGKTWNISTNTWNLTQNLTLIS